MEEANVVGVSEGKEQRAGREGSKATERMGEKGNACGGILNCSDVRNVCTLDFLCEMYEKSTELTDVSVHTDYLGFKVKTEWSG